MSHLLARHAAKKSFLFRFFILAKSHFIFKHKLGKSNFSPVICVALSLKIAIFHVMNYCFVSYKLMLLHKKFMICVFHFKTNRICHLSAVTG
jgi:hypothetical protein